MLSLGDLNLPSLTTVQSSSKGRKDTDGYEYIQSEMSLGRVGGRPRVRMSLAREWRLIRAVRAVGPAITHRGQCYTWRASVAGKNIRGRRTAAGHLI